MVHLARADYEEPDSAIIHQAISQQTQMQEFLHTDGPLVPVPIRATPIAIQNNQISEEDQQSATAQYFGIPLITATNVLGPAIGAVLGAVTANPPPIYIQQTLFDVLQYLSLFCIPLFSIPLLNALVHRCIWFLYLIISSLL